LVDIIRSDLGKRQAYAITLEGRCVADVIKQQQHRVSAYMGHLARWVRGKRFPDLLRYIYPTLACYWSAYNVEMVL
jgi:hypothetical protein